MSNGHEADLFVQSHRLDDPGAKWGFALVRTTTDATTPAAWDTAIQRIADQIIRGVSFGRRRRAPDDDDRAEQVVRATLDLPVITDAGLAGADDNVTRAAVHTWICNSESVSHLARDAYINLDDAAVASLAAPDLKEPFWPYSFDDAYVRVVDATFGQELDPDLDDEPRPDYHGWMRVPPATLTDLYNYFSSGDMFMSEWWPEELVEEEVATKLVPVFQGEPQVDPLDPAKGPRRRLSDPEVVERAFVQIDGWSTFSDFD